MDKIPKAHLTTVHGRLRVMYSSPKYEAARQHCDALPEQLEAIRPQAYNLFDEPFVDIMAVLSLPAGYRRRLLITNSIARPNEGIRRREQVIRIIPNEARITRLIRSLQLNRLERSIGGRAIFRRGTT